MRVLYRCLVAVFLFGGFSAFSSAQKSPADEWFLKHDLFSIPVTRQTEARPGTLIALLPNGSIQWLHPAEVIKAEPQAFTVFTSETKEAIQAGVIAKFLTLGLAAQVKNSTTLTIQQTDFKGTGYEDGPVDQVVLQKGTSVTDQFEKTQNDWDKTNRGVPIYFVQKVFTTADLEVTNGRNILVGGSVNSSTPGSCTDVSLSGGAGSGSGAGAGSGTGTGSGTGGHTGTGTTTGSGSGTGGGSGTGAGTVAGASTGTGTGGGTGSTGGSGAGAGASTGISTGSGTSQPGGGALFCYGRGGKDTLKANHEVPVAMSVCNVYYWEADKSWNCRPALKSIQF